MKLSTNVFFVIVCATLTATNASSQVLSLDSVLARIDRNNPLLKNYDDKARAFDAYAGGATSWSAPMVSAGTFMTPYRDQRLMNEVDQGAWMFSIEQEIPNPSKLKANRKYLESRGDVEEQNRRIAFNDLRAQAKIHYYRWLVAEKKLAVLRENASIMDLTLKLARIRYPYNQGSLGNIYKAEGRRSEIENLELMTRAEIEEAGFALKALMNLRSSDSIMVDTTTDVVLQPARMIADTTALADQRSDIRQIDESIETMRLNQQLQKFQSKPDFKLKYDHMESIGNMPATFSVMAMITIPIAPWSSKTYRSEVKGMHYEIEAMKKGRKAILTEARGMLAGIATRIRKMEQQLENYKTRIIPALTKNHQTLMLAYEENTQQLPIVIDGWEAMTMAQLEYLEKLEEYYLLIVRYEKEVER